MMEQFEDLLHWQAEIADAIVSLQDKVLRYEELEKNLLQRRERAVLHHHLGLKNDLKEIEYALHYVQIQLKEKSNELKGLQQDFQHKVDAIISHYRTYHPQY